MAETGAQPGRSPRVGRPVRPGRPGRPVGPGRPERPLDPRDGLLSHFADELRQLRAAAGYPSYRVLARTALFSASVLSTAASGSAFPSLQVTLAYASACGGDMAEWQRRWEAAAAELAPRTSVARTAAPRPPAPRAAAPRTADRQPGSHAGHRLRSGHAACRAHRPARRWMTGAARPGA